MMDLPGIVQAECGLLQGLSSSGSIGVDPS